MRIVVYGTGGVGGYFGGQLARAGMNVIFIARGSHLEAIRNNGLQVKSIKGDFKIKPEATDNAEAVQGADLLILAVKNWQLIEVANTLKPFLNSKTVVLPLQNGADNTQRLQTVLPPEQVLFGLCKIVSKVDGPGVIDHFAFEEPEIIFGEGDGQQTKRCLAIKNILDQAGIKNKLSDNIHLDIWRKFLFITTVSGIGALTRSVFGEMREDEHIRNIMYQTANEIVAIANAKGIELNNRDVEAAFRAIDGTLYNTTASMQRDIMEGRPSELHHFNGYIVKEGKALHILTPANSFIYHCLIPQEKRARS